MYTSGGTALRCLVLGLGAQCVLGAVAVIPTITAAPIVERQDPNAIELAKIMVTALPASLRQLAATNLPALSGVLWYDFLDDKKPDWFLDLPSNVQSYLIVQYGPSTAWPTASATLSSSASASATSSAISSSTASAASSSTELAASSSATSESASDSGLSQGQKIGIGIGVALGVLALAAVLILWCFACRRKKRKTVTGYEPPPSPGFMPQGAFQEKSTSYQEYRRPLNNPSLSRSQSWDQDDELCLSDERQQRAPSGVPTAQMADSPADMGPALVHTHSSNRARGKRTSYNSLHSVAEVTEPEDGYTAMTRRQRMPRRSSMPLDAPPMPATANFPTTASIRRKPLSQSNSLDSPPMSPASERASGHFSLLRPAILHQDHSGSSSSNWAPTLSSPDDSRRSSANTASSTPPSPVPQHSWAKQPANPFGNDYAYDEAALPSRFVDMDMDTGNDGHDGLYAAHSNLDVHPPVPEKSSRRATTKSESESEWPLQEWPLTSQGGRRERERERGRSPQWDRIYER